ncbi:WhiB family transcriptional regulator [Streptomyces sp. H27-H5]|uniref:WhiB family transcriptional regulator n=1 Tax=Streptomyces sp. H27-H5 TaxID=2996460 RepID=UPI00226E9B95|nr:WhiB family transcriptional regulator [Streptomyces sp. H27-H5]MCY0960821.1 WhiB family transcriptional regulator [Streptomyces sp. H27-H5]
MTRPARSSHAPDTLGRAEDWQDKALCRTVVVDPEAFFPTGRAAAGQQQIDDAKTFCMSCPVRMACALAALTGGYDNGVWGALDEVQRRRILRTDSDDRRQAIRDEWARLRFDPHFDAYAKRTEQEDNGHVRWLMKSTSVTVLGRNWTPAQLALTISQRRPPQGAVKTTCGRPGCVAPEHVADDVVRRSRGRTQKAAA